MSIHSVPLLLLVQVGLVFVFDDLVQRIDTVPLRLRTLSTPDDNSAEMLFVVFGLLVVLHQTDWLLAGVSFRSAAI